MIQIGRSLDEIGALEDNEGEVFSRWYIFHGKEKPGLIKGEKVWIWTKEKMEEDETEDKLNSARTFALIREIGNTLVPGLRLTVDLP